MATTQRHLHIIKTAHDAGFPKDFIKTFREKEKVCTKRDKNDEVTDIWIEIPLYLHHGESTGGRIGNTRLGRAFRELMYKRYPNEIRSITFTEGYKNGPICKCTIQMEVEPKTDEEWAKTDSCPVKLTVWQRDVLVEQVDLVLEDTDDWQLPDNEFQEAIQSWIDILKGLNAWIRVDYWIREYEDICELS